MDKVNGLREIQINVAAEGYPDQKSIYMGDHSSGMKYSFWDATYIFCKYF